MIVRTDGRSYHFEGRGDVVHVLSKTSEDKMSELYRGDEFICAIGKPFIIKLKGELQLETMTNVLSVE